MSTHFNLSNLVPSDLPGLNDAQFRQVVDADLRRRVNPDVLSQRVSDALRDPEMRRRWFDQLTAIKRSVVGQLTAAKDELDAATGPTEARIAQLEELRPGSSQISVLRNEIAQTRSEYLKRKAGRERFLTGVEEHIAIAQRLLSDERDELYDSVVAAERDRYARRLRRLERAIRDHRSAMMADLDSNEEPEVFDLVLWEALGHTDD